MLATIDIPDAVYAELEAEASRDGITVEQLILRKVDVSIAASDTQEDNRPGNRVTSPIITAREPGVLDLTNEQIYEIIPFP